MPYRPIVATVLLVEDDSHVRQALLRELRALGHAVSSAGRALDALREVAAGGPEVVVLDLGLPDLDGGEALKMMRAVSDVPVIVATARDGEQEIIRLLGSGADDYLTKPFSAVHLHARIEAVLRRARTAPRNEALVVGDLRIDTDRREASLAGAPLQLSRREFDLLAHLARHAGRVVRRRQLLAEVWRQPHGDDQTIDVHLSWLRRKLGESAARPRYLHTVRGVGVMLMAPE
ncbi:response regulator transcription factor [Actinocorallia aurea]